MQKPEPLRPEQLVHKNDVARKSRWNGDKRRTTEQQGFDASRKAKGLTVVEGTRKPDPKKVKPSRVFLSRPAESAPSHFDLQQVTENQQRMLSQRQRQENRRKST